MMLWPLIGWTAVASLTATSQDLAVPNEAQPAFYSALQPCPAACAGDPGNWTVYTSIARLAICEQPMLLDFAIYSPLSGPDAFIKLRTCTAGSSDDFKNALAANDNPSGRSPVGKDPQSKKRRNFGCVPAAREEKRTMGLTASNELGRKSVQDVTAVLDKAQNYLANSSDCEETWIAGYHKGIAVGLYAGSAIDSHASFSSAVQHLLTRIANEVVPKNMVIQLCGEGRTADQVLGVVVDSSGDLTIVQNAVKAWNDATCFRGNHTTSQLHDISVFESPLLGLNASSGNSTNSTNSTVKTSHALWARSDCRTQTVVSGDSCGSLASKCKISAKDFSKYNPQKNLCSTLAPGQRVCCSAGTLPDIRPKPHPNGLCASYTVKSGDTCSTIAAANGLTITDLSTFNDKTTWGWVGCKSLMAGVTMCLSKGAPPLPAPQSNAICGPTKPGTKAPKGDIKIQDLNPCPLNACCNIWGQCGITPEFCTAEKGPTGNPGTAPSGHNGCISNCGTSVTNNKDVPKSFRHIGYYESWNWDRPCLNMRADSIDTLYYTHVHWAFATISSNFGVTINDTFGQFSQFQSLSAKKIISFGGWGYSTDPATYNMLRTAMSDGNAATFTNNIVNFLDKNKLDGVDIDWEYPGAHDIIGTPPGLPSDGLNYLKFLKLLKSKLPSGKSLSIAAPASYWYLREFPISDMSEVLDYIVYMTYDLHGQWDYGNQYSQDGCPAGSCLRSHVNLTETNYALAMITKAGVPASKLSVGIASYGRSFKMTKAGCTGPMCTFTGPESGAEKGLCTRTAGYISNREIYGILAANASSPKTWYDKSSNSDILVYDKTEWVAFMSQDTRVSRTNYYKGLHFGGIIDWAVDLGEGVDDDGDRDGDDGLPPPPDIPPCDNTYDTMEDLDAAAGSVPDNCKPLYILRTLSNVLGNAVKSYNDILSDGYDKKFDTYSHAVADSAGNTMHDWIYKNGNKYFSCTVTESTICCDVCKDNQKRPTECDYCFKGSCTHNCFEKRDTLEDSTSVRMNGPVNSTLHEEDHSRLSIRDRPPPGQQCLTPGANVNASEPCPPDYSKRGYGTTDPYDQSVYWSLNSDKSDQFYADLLDNTGIPKTKTKSGRYNRDNTCTGASKPDDRCWGLGLDYDIPIPDGYKASDVTNPKTLVQKALENSNGLADQLQWAVLDLQNDCYGGDPSALVDAVSLPVIMIAQAVDSMAEVAEVAEKIDEEKRKALILAFIGAILFLVPIAGEILGSVAELADIASIIAIMGVVGNAALDVYNVIDDPKNAPLAIFSLILEPLALLDLVKIQKAANIRRGMSDADVAKLGGKVASRMGTVKKLIGACRRDK